MTRLLTGAMLFLLCAINIFPQSSAAVVHLSPETAVNMALNNNLNLEAARIGLDIKKRKSDFVWNQFVPTVTAAGTLSRDNWATTSSGIVVSALPSLVPYSITLPQWHVTGSVSVSLDFSFALLEGIRSYKRDYEAGVIGYEKAKLQIEQAVRKMYNSVLLLDANIGLLRDSYANARRQADLAEANFRAGLVPRITWLQAQVAYENMKPTVSDLENNYKILLGNFALLLGMDYNTPLELDPVSLEILDYTFDLEELISRASMEKPDIQELKAALLTLQSQKKALAISQFTPFLRLGWTLSTLFSPLLDPFKDNLFSGANWDNGGAFSVTLGMSLNGLFPFTQEGQQRKDMEASLQIQNIMLAQMIKDTGLEIFSTLNSLEKNRATVEAQRASVDLAEQSYRLTEEAYRAGLQDFLSVQSAALALDQARLQLLTQQFNYLNDLLDLEYSIGVPFGTLSQIGSR